ncbi:hypothetical protein [Natrinema longum]|uniref:Uncharacterized protein n=1 Tax=Natrinema longum TaxID=370324 RepID=A0A8A2UBJ8_9EURY|nr:hypothetical protein [Natrinema longum]MBZ6496205.1 hypothetical protein [Natrinema longum]QSW85872.1 hypothetical protein J0X27_03285 [Natrinema longum]
MGVVVETPRGLERERTTVTDHGEDRSDGDRIEYRECELCGDRVPAPVYREHLLKECPGR